MMTVLKYIRKYMRDGTGMTRPPNIPQGRWNGMRRWLLRRLAEGLQFEDFVKLGDLTFFQE